MLARMKDKLYWLTVKSFRKLMDRALDADDAYSIHRALQRDALHETMLYVKHNMLDVPSFPYQKNMWHYLVDLFPAEGHLLEFGVYTGGSINFIAKRVKRTIYGFDSFEGIPEAWNLHSKGEYRIDKLPSVVSNVTLVKGWFESTIPGFLQEHPGQCAFVHIDCVNYSSAKSVFDLLGTKIGPGTIISINGYFNYPRWQEGEFQAFQEFVRHHHIAYKYVAYTNKHTAAAMQIL